MATVGWGNECERTGGASNDSRRASSSNSCWRKWGYNTELVWVHRASPVLWHCERQGSAQWKVGRRDDRAGSRRDARRSLFYWLLSTDRFNAAFCECSRPLHLFIQSGRAPLQLCLFSSTCTHETAYISAESSKGPNTQLLEWFIGGFNLTRLWLACFIFIAVFQFWLVKEKWRNLSKQCFFFLNDYQIIVT